MLIPSTLQFRNTNMLPMAYLDGSPAPLQLASVSRRCLLGVAAAMLGGISTRTAAALSAAGKVAAVRGAAAAEAEGKSRNLSPGGDVYVGDLVSTGGESRLGLRLGERTSLRLGANTRLKIDSYLVDAGGDFELIDGAILFEGRSKAGAADLKFRSAYGLIAVRGTRFFAGPSKGVFGVFVREGRVEVSSAGQTIVLSDRQGTDIATPGDPPSPPAIWKPPRIEAAMQSVT
jgi:ferric-dicitrate binding protein FerR (iron transport regulator)